MSISLGAAALLGGGSLLGGLLGGAGNYLSSSAAVKKQIEWERERATHAHQWEVQDLQAAGLNPILSAGGSGATTGGISAPQPDLSPIANAIPNAISAVQAYTDMENTEANTLQTEANTGLTLEATRTQAAKTITEMRNQGLITAQTAEKMANINMTNVEIQKMKQNLELERKEFDYKIKKIESEIAQAKENKNYTEAKKLETQEDTIKKKKENKIFYLEKAIDNLVKISNEANKWVNTGIEAYSRPIEALSKLGKNTETKATPQKNYK